MRRCVHLLLIWTSLLAGQAWAWGNHTLVAYRALETMPEVAGAAPVAAEPLEAFLKAEEKAVEALLAKQETWARANVTSYAPRPDALAFKADAARSDEARRRAFVTALRISPLSKLALFVQPDPRVGLGSRTPMPHAEVSFLPEPSDSKRRFARLTPGEPVPVLEVVATASDEPDYGLDINLWQDSPSEWASQYGFGKIPFGNPALYFSTQAPFHMGFYHQDWLLFKAAPFLHRTLPLLRIHQYSGLAALAFRSGHPYWGWRFAGLALHHIQDLTQPYHANLGPGNSTASMITANALAMAGWPKWRDEFVVLLSNRHLALEKYQNETMLKSAVARQDTAVEKALRRLELDRAYPAWTDLYARDVVAREAFDAGDRTAAVITAAMPGKYVSDPAFDFGANEASIDLLAAMAQQDVGRRAELDTLLADLLGRFGAHSRNTLRGILQAAKP